MAKKRFLRVRRVTTVLSMRGSFGPAVMKGVFSHPAAAVWGIQMIRTAEEFTVDVIRTALDHKTDGFIVAIEDAPAGAFAHLVSESIPFVTVDSYVPALEKRSAGAAFVRIDNHDVGRVAAQSFLAQGRFVSFAFVPPSHPHEWSRRREEGFRSVLDRRELFCETFFVPPTDDPVSDRGYLAKWLRHLPKPAAVMAADDNRAYDVLQACRAARIRIPAEVSLIGVDDETLICEHVSPTLSSIRPDFEEAGRKAAEILERLMRPSSGTRSSVTVVASGLNEIVRRQSTSRESTSGPLVQKALAFIAKNAKRGIGVKDVVEHLGVSRSLVDLRFREVRGESVLGVITEARFKELKRLLSQTDDPIESITRRLGWTSPNYPKNLFRKHFGMSMSDLRAQVRK